VKTVYAGTYLDNVMASWSPRTRRMYLAIARGAYRGERKYTNALRRLSQMVWCDESAQRMQAMVAAIDKAGGNVWVTRVVHATTDTNPPCAAITSTTVG
jgi:hypothetical protein